MAKGQSHTVRKTIAKGNEVTIAKEGQGGGIKIALSKGHGTVTGGRRSGTKVSET